MYSNKLKCSPKATSKVFHSQPSHPGSSLRNMCYLITCLCCARLLEDSSDFGSRFRVLRGKVWVGFRGAATNAVNPEEASLD